MTHSNTSTINEQYHQRKSKGLADFEKLRGKLTFRESPGKCIIAQLLIDYKDLSSEKRNYANPYAYVASMVFPASMEADYKRLVDQNITRHGRTAKAEFLATAEMMSKDEGILVFSDKALLEDSRIKDQLNKIPLGGYLQEKLAEAPGLNKDLVKDQVFLAAIKSVEADIQFPQPDLNSSLKIHSDWARHYQSRVTSPAPGM
jgi:hypothetical protein